MSQVRRGEPERSRWGTRPVTGRMKRDGGGPCTVAGENMMIAAAGRGDRQTQRAHDLQTPGCRWWRRPRRWGRDRVLSRTWWSGAVQVAVLAAVLATVAAPWSAMRSKMVSVMASATESGSGSNLESGSRVATVSAMVLAPGSAMVSGSVQVMASTTTPEVRGWARSQARGWRWCHRLGWRRGSWSSWRWETEVNLTARFTVGFKVQSMVRSAVGLVVRLSLARGRVVVGVGGWVDSEGGGGVHHRGDGLV